MTAVPQSTPRALSRESPSPPPSNLILAAAGRIHRLGQSKDCFVKRFAFKDSIEEAVTMLHDKIKNKEVRPKARWALRTLTPPLPFGSEPFSLSPPAPLCLRFRRPPLGAAMVWLGARPIPTHHPHLSGVRRTRATVFLPLPRLAGGKTSYPRGRLPSSTDKWTRRPHARRWESILRR